MNAERSMAYTPGRPDFNFEIIATASDQPAGAQVYLTIPYQSLVFVQDNEQYQSFYSVTVQVYAEGQEEVVKEEIWADTLQVESYEETQQTTLLSVRERLDLAPGKYLFRVIFEDGTSRKSVAHLQAVHVPDLANGPPMLGRVYLEGYNITPSFKPIIRFHLPSDQDSLRAVVNLYNADQAQRVQVRYALIKYRSDTSLANPPYWLTPMYGSLRHRGVDYKTADTLQTTSYELAPPPKHSTLRFGLMEGLDPGIYRVDVVARVVSGKDSGKTVVQRKQRELSIKSAGFPQVTSVGEAVEALSYIVRKGEIEELQAAADSSQKRHRFDRFWGRKIGNREVAADLLRVYFSRIEQANMLFTNHKEGWKTDRGMVYIIRGTPYHVEHYVDAEVWYYGYSESDPSNVYMFEKSRHYDASGTVFYNYVLQRRSYYYQKWKDMISQWRKGEVY